MGRSSPARGALAFNSSVNCVEFTLVALNIVGNGGCRGRYRFGPFVLDVAECRLLRDGEGITLTGKTFDLLLALVRSAGHLVSREELIRELWPDTVVEEQNLTWNISALRRALGDDGTRPRYIETVRGRGYRFIAAMEGSEPTAAGETIVARQPIRAIALAGVALVLAVAAVVAGVHWFARQPLPLAAAAGDSPPSIAVMPFENLSSDPANAYFVEGIQDMIITRLAGVGGLKLASRTATAAFESHPHDLKAVARKLGVATILEGSVQKAANRVLVNVKLTDARTGIHLWAKDYTRTLDDVFEVESDVAENVAAALAAHLLPEEAERIARTPTGNAEAYNAFLKAEYATRQLLGRKARDPIEAMQTANHYYQEAIARDPGFALAFARLSYVDSYSYWFDIDHTSARIAAARDAAERALALDPGLPEAHLSMGYVHYWGDRDYAAALAEFERTRRSLPNSPDIVLAVAAIQRRLGHWDDALRGFGEAVTLEPSNPRWPYELGTTLTQLGHYDKATAQFDRALAVDPESHGAVAYKALAMLLDGNLHQAADILRAIPPNVDPQGFISGMRYEAAWFARDPNAALAMLADAPDWIEAPIAVGEMPADLLRAPAWILEGDAERARAAYRNARSMLVAALDNQPGDTKLRSFLGLAEAGLGNREAALVAGRRAVAEVPVERDAFDGPSHLATLARICARTGDVETAIRLLRELLAMPSGLFVSRASLATDPIWDPLRGDPAFGELLDATPGERTTIARPAP